VLGFLGRIAGPKVLLGVLIAAGLAIAFLLWRWDSAAAEAQAAHARAEQAHAAAEANAEAARAAELERELLDEVLTDRAKRERRLERQLADTHDRLQEAREAAPERVRECMTVRLPEAMLSELRGTASGESELRSESESQPPASRRSGD
jgi:hypothetical protein